MSNLSVKSDFSIKEVEEYFTINNLKFCNVIDHSNETIGSISLVNLHKARTHKLEDYPISIITDYFESKPISKTIPDKEYIIHKLNNLLQKELIEFIINSSSFANKENINQYLVGGLVRDIIRERQNLDLDITVEYDGNDFAIKLSNEFNKITIKEQSPDFGTAKIIYDSYNELIDVASTREEIYKQPGSLPTINNFSCPIEKDLFRRDFTVNAMAIKINPRDYGQLLDPFNGIEDVYNKTLRVLHSYSFIDDPTRIIRGIEFAVRFDYIFSHGTEMLIDECISSKIFDGFCTERLKLELKSALNLNNIRIIEFIMKYKLHRLLDPQIKLNNHSLEIYKTLIININRFKEHINPYNIWLMYLAVMFYELPKDRVVNIINKLYLTNQEKDVILNSIKLIHTLFIADMIDNPSNIYNFYNNYLPESIITSIAANKSHNLVNIVDKYLNQYSKVTILTNGDTLIKLGLDPGPIFSEIFKNLINQKLDGKINSFEDEVNFIKQHYIKSSI